MTLPKAIICDLDGTLCNHEHRLHFILKEGDYPKENDANLIKKMIPNFKWKPDWEAFYAAMDNDTINGAIAEIIRSVSDSYEGGVGFLFVTGRPHKYYRATQQWLISHHVFQQGDMIFMRPDSILIRTCIACSKEMTCESPNCEKLYKDTRPSHIVKKEIYEREVEGKYDVLFVLEDNEECCEMYKDLDLTVLKVC